MSSEEKLFDMVGHQVILHVRDRICTSVRDLLRSSVFNEIVRRYWGELRERNSSLRQSFREPGGEPLPVDQVVDLLRVLNGVPLDEAARMLPWAARFSEEENRRTLLDFVEGLYNYWRDFDRYMVLYSESGPVGFDQRPYRAFNSTLENLNHIVRAMYRDICENISGDRPRVYRQVSAGCDVGLIAVPRVSAIPEKYAAVVEGIPFIRQVMINPPLIIDPPMNTRTGQFRKVADNPLEGVKINPREWLCFPARVGPLTIFVYFHQRFMGLGCALANLFELAGDDEIAAGPDALYLFGVPGGSLSRYGELPTVFHDDPETGLLVAAVPGEDRFGYFGYLKKMVLTLHNVVMMKRGRMPFHGAMMRIMLRGGRAATVLIIGDNAAGKSESLEALRIMGEDVLEEMRIVADDMGSLEVGTDGALLGYGTAIGAFVRLDDLQQGYAFGQVDRAIFMSPQKVNARVVLPVTSMYDVLRGYPVDILLYANNYEEVDEDHPVIQRFESAAEALAVFREGAAMAKGTTSATGLVHSYFANIFGPPQYRERHDTLARDVFDAAFKSGVFVGQIRTRLGIEGYEADGPREAARALLDLSAGRD